MKWSQAISLILLTVAAHGAAQTYTCPNGWQLGSVCSNHWCYKVYKLADNQKLRMIDDNLCGKYAKGALPAIIRCEAENQFLSKPFATEARTGMALGLYIPANKKWAKNAFVNRDGSKITYTKWGFNHVDGKPVLSVPEPNGLGVNERAVQYRVWNYGNGSTITWHDYNNERMQYILCKLNAVPKSPPQAPPAPTITYTCAKGWVYGSTCGKHWCYKVVPSPTDLKARERMIDDNYCANFDRNAWPISIQCKQENDFFLKPFHKEVKIGFGLGIYIPLDKPWARKSFIHRDGTKVVYTNWGYGAGLAHEPNGGDFYNNPKEHQVIYRAHGPDNNLASGTWHDHEAYRIANLMCRAPATKVVKPVTTPPTKPTPKPTVKSPPVTKPTPKPTTKPPVTSPKPTTKAAPPIVNPPKWPDAPKPPADYTCANGWVYGFNCGKHWCYKLVPSPVDMKIRERMVDDNYCARLDPKAWPATIHCKQENDFFVKPFAKYVKEGFALGLYIPIEKPWGKRSFINVDGTKVDYTNWAIVGGLKNEPNGGDYYHSPHEKTALYVAHGTGDDIVSTTWHDHAPPRVPNLMCKVPATKVIKATPKPPPRDNTLPPLFETTTKKIRACRI